MKALIKLRSTIFFLLFYFILFLSSAPASTGRAKTLKMGFVPGKSPVQIVKMWSFVTRHLTEETGIPVEMVVKDNYKAIYESFLNGKIDIAEGGGYVQGLILMSGKALPLAGQEKFGRPTYKSAIVVRADSGINNYNDLKGKTIAFTNKLSTSGYILPIILFKKLGVANPNDFFSNIYLAGSHDNSIKMLLDGRVDAIAVGDFFIDYAPEKIRRQIKIIATSDPLPLAGTAYNKRLDPTVVGKIKSSLFNMHNKVPFGTLETAEVDRFVEFKPEYGLMLMEHAKEAALLTPLKCEQPPTVYTHELGMAALYYKNKLRLYASILSAILFLAFAGFLLSKKDISKRKASLYLLFPVAVFLILGVIFGISFVSENMKLKARATSSNLDGFFEDFIESVKENEENTFITSNLNRLTKEDNGVPALRIFHDGNYVVDSTGLSLGRSIVDNIMSDKFAIPNTLGRDAKEIFDYLFIGDETWGTAQILLSFTPIREAFQKGMISQVAILFILIFLGITSYCIARKGLYRSPDTEYARSSMEKEPESDQEEHLPMELFSKLKNKIDELAKANEQFRQLRETELIGESSVFLRSIMDAIIRSRDSEPVVICGPTGSGKTGVAKAVHILSNRSDKQFGEFNCAELSSADPLIVLGKLFGYGKNSGITGIPNEGQAGLLEKYDTGTLFLDEVEVLPAHAQQLLLLPLEGRPFNPAAGVGDQKKVNVRFIFASNLPLDLEIKKGTIRSDIYRRIVVRGVINVPPLKTRKDDIPILAQRFLEAWNQDSDRKLSLDCETVDYLKTLDYENYNVSELKTVINVAADIASFAESDLIKLDHLKGTNLFKPRKDKLSRAPYDHIFDGEELSELKVLREKSFNITMAEEQLGYSQGAKTLTNHFRGLCYKTLSVCLNRGEGFDLAVKSASGILIGFSKEKGLEEKLANKIRRFVERVKDSTGQRKDPIYNNLPRKYHSYLENLINQFKTQF
jgi:phosphate/phosphite/phosphonate ABC transporter binding protein